ncbi:MAG: tetratricopeptide repeat protein [Pyrinomonadaceae bacterium]|nr:tetratricopeptide repeat protein [Pyrinomonadaceae bacterium]
MKQKIFIGLITYFLLFIFCTAVVSEIHAQPKEKDKRSKPNDKARKLLAEGNKLFAKKDYRAAINKYAEAIVISPSYPEAHYWKGYAHYYLNESNEAGEELDLAFSQGYNALAIYKIRWVVNYQRENYDAALSDVDNGLLKEKNNFDFINGRGEILVKKGSYKEAIEALNNSIKLNPNRGDLYYFLALSYSKTGDFNQQGINAVEAVNKATKFTGESYALLGDSKVLEKNPTAAMDAYKRALNVKPDMPEEFYINVTQFYRAENRLGDAIDIAREGLKLYPRSTPLLVGLTWYYSLADRHGEAVGAGRQAVKNAPDDAAAHTNLCRAYNDRLSYAQAVISCNNALKIKPNDGETFFYLARASKSLNKPALFADYLKKAIAGLLVSTRDNPRDPDGFYLLANAYYYDGQYKKAIEAYQESINLSPNFMKANYNLGNAFFADNNLNAARMQYDKLLKLDLNYANKLKQTLDGK